MILSITSHFRFHISLFLALFLRKTPIPPFSYFGFRPSALGFFQLVAGVRVYLVKFFLFLSCGIFCLCCDMDGVWVWSRVGVELSWFFLCNSSLAWITGLTEMDSLIDRLARKWIRMLNHASMCEMYVRIGIWLWQLGKEFLVHTYKRGGARGLL